MALATQAKHRVLDICRMERNGEGQSRLVSKRQAATKG